jgi:hypothetical protein
MMPSLKTYAFARLWTVDRGLWTVDCPYFAFAASSFSIIFRNFFSAMF